MKPILWIVFCLSGLGCMRLDAPQGDVVPPIVVSFEPIGSQVKSDARVTVTFSEPVASEVLEGYLVVLVAAAYVDYAFLTDIDNPPLSTYRMDKLVDCLYTISDDGTRLDLVPMNGLASKERYAVVVSAEVLDLVGNPLVDELVEDEFGRMVGQQSHAIHEFSTETNQSDPTPTPEPTPEPTVSPTPGPTPEPTGSPTPEPTPEPTASPSPEPTPSPTPGPIAMIVFSEVFANPEGTENQGEYIEIANLGSEDADLSGFRIDDQAGAEPGDLLSVCEGSGDPVIQPGGAALLVGQAFVSPPDLQPDTLLLCTDRTTITPYGLKNTGGEVLVLKDAYEREVCRYGGWVDMSSCEGCAAERVDLEVPDGPDNWLVPETDPCKSPGWLVQYP